MIYQLAIKNTNTNDIIEKFSKSVSFIMSNGFYYLLAEDIDKLKKDLNIDFSDIVEININNYSKIQNEFVKNWCKEKLTIEELKKFEQSKVCQERLDLINNYLDLLENIEKEYKEGGDAIASKKNTRKSSSANSTKINQTN